MTMRNRYRCFMWSVAFCAILFLVMTMQGCNTIKGAASDLWLVTDSLQESMAEEPIERD